MSRNVALLAAAVLVTFAPQAPVFADVLFSDDFSDGDANGWTEYDGVFAVIDGVYNISASYYCNDARAIAGERSWTDYTVDVDFNYGASHAAVLFHVQEVASGCDAGRYYQFYAYESQVGLCKMNYNGGYCTILRTAAATTTPNAWHHLRFTVHGASFAAWIDGAEVLSYDMLTTYTFGQIGLKTINCCTNQYDNVVVTSYGATATSADSWGRIKTMYR